MKSNLLLLFVAALLASWGCTDKCRETRVFRQFTPQTFTAAQLRQSIAQEEARTLVNPGKIYYKDGYLFINEVKEGIHVIDNRNPENPKMVTFLRIPGNGDMAVRNNILYADSYMDLVALDISNPASIKPAGRAENVFRNGTFDGAWWSFDSTRNLVSDQRVDYVTQTVNTNCDNSQPSGNWWWGGVAFFADTRGLSNMSSAAPSQNSNGTGGSMARFTLYNNYLYTVGQNELVLFDIQNPTSPRKGSRVNLGWGIETIFPYKDKLFIGSTTGMHIYDASNPAKPTHLSTFQHAMACDPVVVENDIAYVTLRSGNFCTRASNQLDVVDVSNAAAPRLIKTYPMQNPHGLGIDAKTLFVCEGRHGLKSLDANSILNITELQRLTGMDAYDVIPLGNYDRGRLLLMIGKDGLYQFDYSNPRSLRQLSKIPVDRPW
ncbi:LVIVD repeat-containing protein [Tellurirhabdus rosea]|uniref:LVIVD repeat-containing protein n=1 Tax=Tellurirhabdus rosea TaxID=2674997 RepID=UPI002257F2D5|nr:hypothetical protein [Tellurirhabdus rosea]